MSKEFETVISRIKDLRDTYLEGLYALRCYEALNNARAIDMYGQEQAEKNVLSMNRYSNFFATTNRALHLSSLLNIAKMFDESDEALHFNYVLNYIANNQKKLSNEDFKSFHKNRQFINELYEQYKGMTFADVRAVRDDIQRHEKLLRRLKTYRDQYLAHNDRKKDPVEFSFDEIRVLFALAEKTLNLFTSKLDDSATMYGAVEENVTRDVKYLLAALERSERYRQQEIKKHVEDLKNHVNQ